MGEQYELGLKTPQSDWAAVAEIRSARNVPALIVQDQKPGPESLRLRAQKAQPPLLPLSAVAFDAFRLTVVQCRWHIVANVAPAVEKRDVEALHQLRVALRRLRVALSSFGGEFRTPQIEAVKLRAKSLAGGLAPARDLDVFTRELLEPAASANGSREAFDLLRARAEAARRDAWDDAVAQIAGPRFRIFMADLGEIIDHGIWPLSRARGNGAGSSVLAMELPARKVAERMLTHRQRQASRRARRLDSLSVGERHALRISLKKLRYTAEFFAPLFEPAAVQKFGNRLSRMQDILGTVNDVAVAKNILEALILADDARGAANSSISFAGGIVYGWHLERAAHAWRDAIRRWKKFAGTREFWLTGTAQ